jgi:hypothetical protein
VVVVQAMQAAFEVHVEKGMRAARWVYCDSGPWGSFRTKASGS